MKNLAFVILVFFFHVCFAQDNKSIRADCDFLKDLHFKNGTDTIVVRVSYQALYSQGTGLILKDLERKKKLNAKILTNAIGFKVANYNRHFMGAYHVKNKTEMDMLDQLPEGSIVYLTCIVYEGYYNYREPFFTIDKLEIKGPSKN